MLDFSREGEHVILDASAGSALTASLWGRVKSTTDPDGVKQLIASMELTGGADTLYTNLKNQRIEDGEILIVNRTGAVVTVEAWMPQSGVAASEANRILPTGFTIPANGLRLASSFGTPQTAGTVTSVAMTVPAEFSVAGSPITGSGTLAVTKATQAANLGFRGPTSGGAAVPTFRADVIADLGFIKRGSGTLDFGAIGPNLSADLTLTVTGAVDGDEVIALGMTAAVISGGTNCGNISFFAWVSGADTVTVRCTNHDLALTADPASGTFKASVLRA